MTIEQPAIYNVESRWNVMAIYMPLNGVTEYILADNENRTAKAWAEINYVWTKRMDAPSYLIDASRIKNSLQAASMNRLPFILAVQWTDFLGWIAIDADHSFKIKNENGRDKLVIPVTAFKEIKQRDGSSPDR